MHISQRLLMVIGIAGTVHISAAANTPETSQFQDLCQKPDSITVVTETNTCALKSTAQNVWLGENIEVTTQSHSKALTVALSAPNDSVKSVAIFWKKSLNADWKYLGDAWERGYGDLEWKTLDAKRIMPWYFLASDGKITHGYGVKVASSALCYWTTDKTGITLHANVQCGGKGVQLGKRRLQMCEVISRQGGINETPFFAAQSLCKLMCPSPRLPKQPVYGFNDWYCTYGHDTAEKFLTNVAYITALAPNSANPPFAVVDDGWQWRGANEKSPGLWDRITPSFSTNLTMREFADGIRALGARPGLWYRPLTANADQPMSWRLQRDSTFLDPTVPEVRALIRKTVARFHNWGYQLIKHDFTTFDICGRWGPKMGAQVTTDGWAFADRSKTTAEVIRDLYQDIRDSAGDETLILGCNTMGHLSAGLFEIQRIGDDTSGREWNRTREMGVNSLAFRAAQHGTFFAVDGDCAGQVSQDSVPWEKNSQWLDLLARSGTPLFVSFPRETVSPEQERALRDALIAAASTLPLAEPLDWLTQRTPTEWKLDGKKVSYSW